MDDHQRLRWLVKSDLNAVKRDLRRLRIARNIVSGDVALVILVGCSENVEKDLAQCEVKAMELFKPTGGQSDWGIEPTTYVDSCMRAAGYSMDFTSGKCRATHPTYSWDCWYKETWFSSLTR